MRKLWESDVIELATTGPDEGFTLPHHCVWGRKPRVVFDGSASDGNGVSFNACLDSGPNLLESLVDILFRFRLHRCPIVADIQTAFHALQLRREDRLWTKFIWGPDTFQFRRVPFGLSCSPFLLHSTIKFHAYRSLPPAVHSVNVLRRLR